MAQKQSLAQLIRNREADTEQAELRRQFLAEVSPELWQACNRIFGPLKIDKVRRMPCVDHVKVGASAEAQAEAAEAEELRKVQEESCSA